MQDMKFMIHPLILENLQKEHKLKNVDLKDSLLERSSIKLLTYNMFMRPPPVKTNHSDHKNARLRNYITHLEKFDIICNQEVFTTLNSRKQQLIHHAKKAGFLYHAVPKTPAYFSRYYTDGGLLILSRFPIVE